MIKTGLEFMQGTTDECKRVVGRLFNPSELLGVYRAARKEFGTGDLVMEISEEDPSHFNAWIRTNYIQRARQIGGGKRLPLFMRSLEEHPAHKMVSMPFESEAMWLAIPRGMQAMPIMCVIYAIQFEVPDSADTSDTVSLAN